MYNRKSVYHRSLILCVAVPVHDLFLFVLTDKIKSIFTTVLEIFVSLS